jgi:hypothetical protein
MIIRRWEVRTAVKGQYAGIYKWVDFGGEPVSRHFFRGAADLKAILLNGIAGQSLNGQSLTKAYVVNRKTGEANARV